MRENKPAAADLLLVFHGDIQELLRIPPVDGKVVYPLVRRASIKDIIEALGIPHTEVGKILVIREEQDFSYIPLGGEIIDIYPFSYDVPTDVPTVLRPQPLAFLSYLADKTVVKLARNLRMAGIDTETLTGGSLREIAQVARQSGRILLTRNRELLKISTVVFGQLIRSTDHRRQLLEVVERYRLRPLLRPFSRCLCCNTVLESVEKADIMDRLEPLTKAYYQDFKKCSECDKIYWSGSHRQHMTAFVDLLR